MRTLKSILLLLFLTCSAYSITPAQFQEHLNQVNETLAKNELPPIGKLSVLPIYDLPESARGYVSLAKDLKTLEVHLHQRHLSDSTQFSYLIAKMAGVLAYPLKNALKYEAPAPRQGIQRVLSAWRMDYSKSFLHLLQMSATDSKDPAIKLRERIFSLVIESHIPKNLESVSGREMSSSWKEVFPDLKLDEGQLKANGDRALSEYKSIYRKKSWFKFQNFIRSLGSKELIDSINANSRSQVADFIEARLPRDILTRPELQFWENQVDAIRHPDLKNAAILLRGGPLDLTKRTGGTYLAKMMKAPPKNQIYRRPWIIDDLNYRTSVFENMFAHTTDTNSQFISTTGDEDTARHFSKKSGFMSVIKIDPRRAIPPPFSDMGGPGEFEALVPWMIFPDEIVASSNTMENEKLLKVYGPKAEESYKRLLSMHALQELLKPVASESCTTSFLREALK